MATKKPKLINKSEWGMALHTALRKCCDSTPTTIAYNAVCELQEAWKQYLVHLNVNFKPNDSSHEPWEELKRVSLKWNYHNAPRQEINIAIILHSSFKLFSDIDWKGYVEFLYQ